ncbi:MAG: hypothetical protein ACYCSF_08410 [Acidimicrobiales bacterium]
MGKKIENHAHAVSLHFFWYNLGRLHQCLPVRREGQASIARTPAMAAGVADHAWSVTQLAQRFDEPWSNSIPLPRGWVRFQV